jgi:hypothetical protein
MYTTTQGPIRWLLKTAAVSVLMLGPLGTGAQAARATSVIAGDGFGRTPIRVVSENGTSWTKIEESRIALPVKVDINAGGAVIHNYKTRQLGGPEGQYFQNVTPDRRHDGEAHFSTIYAGSTNHLTNEEKQRIIASCNEKLGVGKGIHQSHDTFGGVGVELITSFIYSSGENGLGAPDKSHANVSVFVKCEGKHGRADDVAAKEPNFGVKGIHLRFMTTAGYPTKPNPGTQCQMSQAKVRLETSKAGGVKFRLWTKVGNQPIQNQFVETWSKFIGAGKYEATFTKNFTVDKTTPIQAMAEDLTNPIGQSTGWKEVKLDCTGAGGGGFAGTPGNSNPDGQPHSNPQSNPSAPQPIVPGVAVGTKVAPLPPRPAPQTPPRLGQGKAQTMPQAVAAKDRFQLSKPHVN